MNLKCEIILIINFDVSLHPGNTFFIRVSIKSGIALKCAGDACYSPYLVSRIISYFDQEFKNYSTTVGMKLVIGAPSQSFLSWEITSISC